MAGQLVGDNDYCSIRPLHSERQDHLVVAGNALFDEHKAAAMAQHDLRWRKAGQVGEFSAACLQRLHPLWICQHGKRRDDPV